MSGRFVYDFFSRIVTVAITAVVCALGATAWLLTVSAPASAFEALDGRLQAHGFFESQMRMISKNYHGQWDMTQWYQVFNLELELDILPDGFGPIDLLQGYVRGEVRYDCVYTAGCGMFKSVNSYGNRSKSLPRRLTNARERTTNGTIALPATASGDTIDRQRRSGPTRDPITLDKVSGFSTLAGSPGADQAIGNPTNNPDCQNSFVDTTTYPNLAGLQRTTCASLVGGDYGIEVLGTQGSIAVNDDPFRYVFANFEDFRFTQVNARGGAQYGMPTRVFGPWLPKNFIYPNATLADRINPFDRDETSPVVAAAAFNTRFLSAFNSAVAGLDPNDPNDAGAIEIARENAQQVALGASQSVSGRGANPFRPIPIVAPGGFGAGTPEARGIYYPSAGLRAHLGEFDNPQFNFSEAEREWNRGASQQDEKELKEAYLDIEMFDSRLWLRLGKQSIVWGKTELFRTTDQFNPQDLALASLPSLEESRIALWAARAVYSFYEVGPFSDVRLEGAFNYDDFEPADLGACGEAYTPNLVCELTFGMFAHGTAGIGVAGVDRPPDPWQNLKGWEVGGRLEWRWDRFSFAITDFWGYNDTPTLERISTYERNVDPDTGRPRQFAARGPCTISPDDLQGRPQNPACLTPGPTGRNPYSTPVLGEPDHEGLVIDDADLASAPGNALYYHHANQQVFAMICSTTIGFSNLDRSSCAQTVFGSTATVSGLYISQIIGGILRGSSGAAQLFSFGFYDNTLSPPIVMLNNPDVPQNPVEETASYGIPGNGGTNCRNSRAAFGTLNLIGGAPPQPSEAERPLCGGNAPIDSRPGAHGPFAGTGVGLAQGLSAEQEALLGCGPFWGTNCDDDGLDLLNTEVSALMQSFTGVEGTNNGWRTDGMVGAGQDISGLAIDPQTGLLRQPGTVGFLGATPCTFGDLEPHGVTGSETARLPGCRSPYNDVGKNTPKKYRWNPAVDGDPRGALVNDAVLAPGQNPGFIVAIPGTHPFTGQPWDNEMAVVSWNFQALLVGVDLIDPIKKINTNPNLTPAEKQQKVIARAYSTKPNKCSFVQPQFCGTPQAFFAVTGVTRPTVEAGGSGRYGRRTFTWHSGGEAMLVYDKRNVLGFSADFAEDFTKSNWGLEFTWINDIRTGDADQRDGLSTVDTYNLTISVDRPTFINFLNANRTFFFNSQWFFQYIDNYRSSFYGNGAFNVLGTFAVSTGYYQDRLLPSLVFVYDVQSVSGAALPQITYRYNEAFSITVGAALFMGREQLEQSPVNPLGGVSNRQPPNIDKVGVENGLAVIKDRDEVFLRLRYTF